MLCHHTVNMSNQFRKIEKHLTCPFDSSHSILPDRMLKHIDKCKKNNEEIASRMLVCPYAKTHYLKIEEYHQHVLECPRQHEINRWFPKMQF